MGQQEDLWLLRGGNAQRDGVLPAEVDRLYDAFRSSRADRAGMPLLAPVEARRFIAEVRARAFDQLDRADDLFPYAMVEQHEQQHVETMIATHQLRDGPLCSGAAARYRNRARCRTMPCWSRRGEFVLGVDASYEPWSLDNERPATVVDLPAFALGACRSPMPNGRPSSTTADITAPSGGRHAAGPIGLSAS